MQLSGRMLVYHAHSLGLNPSTATHSKGIVQPSLTYLTPGPYLRPHNLEGAQGMLDMGGTTADY